MKTMEQILNESLVDTLKTVMALPAFQKYKGKEIELPMKKGPNKNLI